MDNALIIGDDRRSVDILEESLWNEGYRSIVAVRDASDAWTVLQALRPKLIVVTADAVSNSSTDDLYSLSEKAGAPIIVATADAQAALRNLGPNVSLDGPYGVDAIAAAHHDAVSPRPAYAHAA